MWLALGKTLLAAVLISFVSWLAEKKTGLAGFLTALPLTTLLALAFSHLEWGDTEQSVAYAKNILAAVPLSLLFFVPFLCAQKFNLSFWGCYSSGVCLLGVGYLIHSNISKFILTYFQKVYEDLYLNKDLHQKAFLNPYIHYKLETPAQIYPQV